jgi:hypothetical protein
VYFIAFGLLVVGWLVIFLQVIHLLPISLCLSIVGHSMSFVGVLIGIIAVFAGQEEED